METESRKLARNTKDTRGSRAISKMKRIDSASSCASWEALSECSDSSWLAVSECTDANWLDLATEADMNIHLEAKLAEIFQIRETCENELSVAMPALEAALASLNSLSKADIGEVRAMQKPPQGVVIVSKALCFCFGVSPGKMHGSNEFDYWKAARQSLWGDVRILERMCNYDKDNIAPAVMEKLLPLETDPAFQPDEIKRASLAAYGVCLWVRGIIAYDRAAKHVLPKKMALQQAERELDVVRAALEEKRSSPAKQQQPLERPGKLEELELPTVEEAFEGIKKLKLAHFQELKACRNPPSGVKLTMEALCVSLSVAPMKKRDPNSPSKFVTDYWEASKEMLADPVALLARMVNFKDEWVGAKTLEALTPYIFMDSFDPKNIKRASSACEAICLWVRTMYQHHINRTSISDVAVATESSLESVSRARTLDIFNSADALGKVCKNSVTEIKSYANPPQMVMKTILAVLTILEEEEPTWKAAEGMLADPAFLQRLQALNIAQIKESTWQKVKCYVDDENFRPDRVRKASCAASALCEWVHAVYKEKLGLNSPRTTATPSEWSLAPDSDSMQSTSSSPLQSPSAAAECTTFVCTPALPCDREVDCSLATFHKEDIQELKALGKPPYGIALVCGAVMQLLASVNPSIDVDERGVPKDVTWKGSQKMMNNPAQFLSNLKSFKACIDCGRVPQGNIERARKVQLQMGDDFCKENMAKKSAAVAGLCIWVSNVIEYHDSLASA